MPRIRLALLGSGTVAREEHLRAIKLLPEQYDVVAIYSRSQANAAALANTLPRRQLLITRFSPLSA